MPEYILYAHASLPTMIVVQYQDTYFLVPNLSGAWKHRQPYRGYQESLRTIGADESKRIAARLGLGHGGYRENAGRTSIGDLAMQKRTVSLSTTDITYLSDLGEGNLSAGIREAVKRLKECHK